MTNEKSFKIKIDGTEQSYTSVSRLVDVLKLAKAEIEGIDAQNEKSTKISQKKVKILAEEEKVQAKLVQTLGSKKQLEVQIAREQMVANQALKERAAQLEKIIETETALSKSIEEKRLQLDALRSTYQSLNEEEKNSLQIGEAMSEQIRELGERYEALKSSIGDSEPAVGEYENATKSLSNTITQFTETSKGLLSSLQLGIGLYTLFGGESKTTARILAEVSKMMTLVNTLQTINNTLIKDGAILTKISSAADSVRIVQEKAKAAAIMLSTKSTIAATVAQKAFNLVAKANPYLLLATGLIALTGAFVGIIKHMSEAAQEQEKFTSGIDKSVHATKEARDAYNEHLKKVRDLNLEYAVLTGSMTSYDAEIQKIKDATEDRILAIEQEAEENRKRVEEERGFWGDLFGIALVGQSYMALIHYEKTQEIAKINEKARADRQRAEEEGGNQLNNEYARQGIDREKLAKQASIKLLKGKDKELAELELRREKEIAEYKKAGLDTLAIEQYYSGQRLEVERKYNEESVKKKQDALNKQKQLDRKNLEYIQKYEDLLTTSIEGEYEKRRKQAELNYQREKENLNKALMENEDLSEEAKKAIDETILLLEKKFQKELSDIKEDERKNSLEKDKNTLSNRKELLDIEKNEISKFFNDVEKLSGKYLVKNSSGIIDLESSKKNLLESKSKLQEYIGMLDKSKNKTITYYDDLLKLQEEGSIDYKKTLHEKEKALEEYQKATDEAYKKIETITENAEKLQGEYLKSLVEQIDKYTQMMQATLDSVFSTLSMYADLQVDEARSNINAINELYDDAVRQREESDSRLQDLEESAMNATASRREAIKKLIEEEMLVNQQLAEQESRLAAEKEKKEKALEKAERQQKKIQLMSDIARASANVALSVTSAMTAGPIIGKILAGIAAAMGAIQVGIMTKQLSKLEDGGLLQGKRHSQGGMRIEGTNIEVEGGEYVVNRNATKKNIELIDYINSQNRELGPEDVGIFFNSPKLSNVPVRTQMQNGGVIQPIVNIPEIGNSALVEAIREIKIQPVVSVTEINNVNQQVVDVADIAGL